MPPPRHCGARIEPWRARPVPFWRHGFEPPPATSARVFVLCVPARRCASCALTTWCISGMFGSMPKRSSGASTVPALPPDAVVTSSFTGHLRLYFGLGPRSLDVGCLIGRGCGVLLGVATAEGRRCDRGALHRVAHEHDGAVRTRHCASHEQQPALGVAFDHFEVQRGDALVAEMPVTSTRSPAAKTSAPITWPTAYGERSSTRSSARCFVASAPFFLRWPSSGLVSRCSFAAPNAICTAEYPSRSGVFNWTTRQGPAWI